MVHWKVFLYRIWAPSRRPIISSIVCACHGDFSAILRNLVNDRNFKFHWRAKPVGLTHLIFVDDIFLFCRGGEYSIYSLLRGVTNFFNVSGLKPDASRSQRFFVNMHLELISNNLQVSGFQGGSLPIKYWGLPSISNKLKTRDCTPLVQRLCAKIEMRTSRFLRFAGRLQLIKTILFGIQS